MPTPPVGFCTRHAHVPMLPTGTHFLSETIELTAQDSQLTIRNADGEEAASLPCYACPRSSLLTHIVLVLSRSPS